MKGDFEKGVKRRRRLYQPKFSIEAVPKMRSSDYKHWFTFVARQAKGMISRFVPGSGSAHTVGGNQGYVELWKYLKA